MLVSAIQQNDSVIHIHIEILFSVRLLHNIEQSSLCCTQVLVDYLLYLFIYEQFILYWIIVDLQCCASFRYITKWFIYTYTCVFSFSNSLPFRPLHNTEQSPCAIQLVLVDHPFKIQQQIRAILYMSILNSQFILLPPIFPLC